MSSPVNVLLVEDDELQRSSLSAYLSLVGLDVTAVADGISFYRAIGDREFQVAVVDLGLPDQSGEVLIEYLRHNTCSAIIVVTARDTVDSRVACYSIGADLFLGKPVVGRELAAAIRSLAGRRNREPVAVEKPDTWVLSRNTRTLACPDGRTIALTGRECQFLAFLANQPSVVIERSDLMRELYGRDDESASHALDTLVRRTRQKVADAFGKPAPILTEYGAGYSFTAKIQIAGG